MMLKKSTGWKSVTLLLLLGMLLSGQAMAMSYSKIYGASFETSEWDMQGSALACDLRQKIPEFGEGVFSKKAGEQLGFYLKAFSDELPPGSAEVVAEGPAWKHNVMSRLIGTAEITDAGMPLQLGKSQASAMLGYLTDGLTPTISASGDEEPVKVVISTVNFQQAYQEYVACLAQLLPVSFKQIARSAIFFDNNQVSLSEEITEQLNIIARYVKADSKIRRIFIDGHTDNVGDKKLNRRLSRTRAEAVISYFKQAGVNKKILVSRFHGDRYPALKNDTDENRARNRRVTIRLVR